MNDYGKTYLREFEKVDTARLNDKSKEEIIEMCRCSVVQAGWGQLAELMKRFKKLEIE